MTPEQLKRRGFVEKLYAWSGDKIRDRKLRRFGGLQTCPWCKQCAQDGDGWNFKVWPRDLFLDVLTCGVCGGTSLWRFEMFMFYVAPLDAPEPNRQSQIPYDVENATLKESQSRGLS